MTKPTPRLLDESTLEQRPVVANCSMNRLRTLRGSNGYDAELHIDALTELRRRLTRKTVVRWLRRAFQRAQIDYVSGKHLVRRVGGAELRLPFRFLGADEDAGPNYTGQPAVNSHYRIVTTPPLGVRPA